MDVCGVGVIMVCIVVILVVWMLFCMVNGGFVVVDGFWFVWCDEVVFDVYYFVDF